MADDRMRNDDFDRNMGGAGKSQEHYGKQQSPGRKSDDDDLTTGQRGIGHDQQSEPEHLKDDFGTSGESDLRQGGRNR